MMRVNIWRWYIFVIISMSAILFSGLSILHMIEIMESKGERSKWILFVWVDNHLSTVSISSVFFRISTFWVISKQWHLILRFPGIFWVYLWELLKRLKSFFMWSINPWNLIFNVHSRRIFFNVNRASIDIMQSIIEFSFRVHTRIRMCNWIQVLSLLNNFFKVVIHFL